jgi:hypothetical protein
VANLDESVYVAFVTDLFSFGLTNLITHKMVRATGAEVALYEVRRGAHK